MVPTSAQLAWQRAEFGLFCHFGINTFYGKEWSDGTLSPAAFDPRHFEPAQWVETAQQAGMRYLILTAKHHDGFCLWPTATTAYSVRSSPFGGDVVQAVADACTEARLPFGLYLSPWDRNAVCYADPAAYDDFYAAQLTELCTRYGPLFELWFDGAGSEGRIYDWERFMDIVQQHQPQAMIFNMGRPTIRWAGNEDGVASDPNYLVVSELDVSAFSQGKQAASLVQGEDVIYLPPECDVAIRQNWFWQPDDALTLKSCEHLLGIYYRSVGRGANLLLNLGPNRDGLLDAADCKRLREMRAELDRRFAAPLVCRLRPEGDAVWLEMPGEEAFDHLVLQEDLTRGQIIEGYRIETESGDLICAGSTIGQKKIDVFSTQRTRRLRARFAAGTAARARSQALLTSATLYHTGVQDLPTLGEKLDYEAWGARAS